MDKIDIMSQSYEQNKNHLESLLRLDKSYDLIGREIYIADKHSTIYFIDGYVKDDIMEKIMQFLMSIKAEDLAEIKDAQTFADKYVTYVEVDINNKYDDIITGILSGTIALMIEGFDQIIMIDARTYPARGIEEPNDDRVLRGSRDGFVETLVHNTALIRRRIRDPNLTMEIMRIGEKSKTDIVLCYMENVVDKKFLNGLRNKLQNIKINTLTMSQESLAECLIKPQLFNPFPKIRYSERPDAACASVIEGSILIVVDNSPSVMVLPTSFFDFVQDTNDYYFPPIVGTYLRLIRILIFGLTLFLTPIWYLLMQYPDVIPDWLSFIKIEEPNNVPIILQLLIIEFMIDGLKLASLNTPNALSNSFSIVGALILGDFAVKAQWFVPEVLLYMAFVAIANFTQPSFELGYAFKLFRMFILILTAIFRIWGFIAGIVIMFIILLCSKTLSGRSYLYTLIPFKWSALSSLLIRKPISKKNS